MELMKSANDPKEMYEQMIGKVANQIFEWKGKLEHISELLQSEVEPEFHEVQNFVMDRLTSYACMKNQGYVMNGFELDSEKAGYLFLEPCDDGFELNKATKPDFVIIVNRLLDQDDLCAELEMKAPSIVDEDSSLENETQSELKKY